MVKLNRRTSRPPCGPRISTEFLALNSPVVVTSTTNSPVLGVVVNTTESSLSPPSSIQLNKSSTTALIGIQYFFFISDDLIIRREGNAFPCFSIYYKISFTILCKSNLSVRYFIHEKLLTRFIKE